MRRRTASGAGFGKPETFNFLGFNFYLWQVASGQVPSQKENPARPHAGEAAKPSSRSLRQRRHQPIPVQGNG